MLDPLTLHQARLLASSIRRDVRKMQKHPASVPYRIAGMGSRIELLRRLVVELRQ